MELLNINCIIQKLEKQNFKSVKGVNMFEYEFDKKQIQQALPEYKYIKKLGSGAFAVVHLVQHKQTHEQYALKKVTCFGLGEYEKAGAANEARILSSLDHKNVIKVKSCIFDNNEDIMYIFMEYAESGDLSVLIDQAREKKKRIPEDTIWKIIADVSDGLRYLHQNSIIHRDIKPANIFRKGKMFKIGDMNVSKIVKAGIVASTKTGSPLYTAPEVWNQEEYDYQCDVWSLGVVVYELCCMKVPYEAQTIIELTRKITEQKLKSIPSIYSPFLDDILKKMLDTNPNKRMTAEQVYKKSSTKLQIEAENLDEEAYDNLMDTIVFPDTHQRWINLIPSPLPPKTSRKDIAKSQVMMQDRVIQRVKSNQKQQKNQQCELMIVTNAFRSNERRPPMMPNSKSKGKNQNIKQQKQENRNEIKIPNLPPIYRSNSPMVSKKKPAQSKQKSIQKRERSNSRTKRQSAIELVIESKSILNLDKTQ